MRKAIVDAERHGAEGRAGVDVLLAGANKESVIPRWLWWQGLLVRVWLDLEGSSVRECGAAASSMRVDCDGSHSLNRELQWD
jgi:hypothetical protein